MRLGRKKMRPPLGIGGPERRVSLPVSFSHRRVGSSILASLSEAGGNELLTVASKPLPPRFVTPEQLIHSKRAHAWSNAGEMPMMGVLPSTIKTLFTVIWLAVRAVASGPEWALQSNWNRVLN